MVWPAVKIYVLTDVLPCLLPPDVFGVPIALVAMKGGTRTGHDRLNEDAMSTSNTAQQTAQPMCLFAGRVVCAVQECGTHLPCF